MTFFAAYAYSDSGVRYNSEKNEAVFGNIESTYYDKTEEKTYIIVNERKLLLSRDVIVYNSENKTCSIHSLPLPYFARIELYHETDDVSYVIEISSGRG